MNVIIAMAKPPVRHAAWVSLRPIHTQRLETAIQASILETKKGIEDLSQAVRDESKTIKSDVSQVTSAKETSTTLLGAIQKADATITELQVRSKERSHSKWRSEQTIVLGESQKKNGPNWTISFSWAQSKPTWPFLLAPMKTTFFLSSDRPRV